MHRLFFPLLFLCAAWMTVQAAPMAKILIVDGQNNHDWRATTPDLVRLLEESGRFQIQVATTPPATAPASEHEAFRPDFHSFAAVVLNWNDYGVASPVRAPWMDDLLAFTRDGGGLVLHHAAGFEFHPDFAAVAGLVWQKADFGDGLYLDENGNPVRVPKGQGTGSGHGPRTPHTITHWNHDHPILAGLPGSWTHAADEAWFGQRGPAQGMTILATAKPPETNRNEPMIWTRAHGSGRVFVCRLGHDRVATDCAGFRTVFSRGCEWAATGKVELPPAKGFAREPAATGAPSPAIPE